MQNMEFLQRGLIKPRWNPSYIDPCLLTKDGIILGCYDDDAFLVTPSQAKNKKEVESQQKDCTLTDDGALKDDLGTRFDHKADGTIELN